MPTNMIKIQGRTHTQLVQIISLQNSNPINKIHRFIFTFNVIISSTWGRAVV
jgi:hypothetical protein